MLAADIETADFDLSCGIYCFMFDGMPVVIGQSNASGTSG
jgi:hypothetical protein